MHRNSIQQTNSTQHNSRLSARGHTPISILWITLFHFSLSSQQLLPLPPASIQHPEITAFPLGRQAGRQAAEGTAMDMFCLLSNERRNVTVGLSAGPSIHVESAQSIKQLADSSALHFYLFLSLFLLPIPASFSRAPALIFSFTERASSFLFLIANKQMPRSVLPLQLCPPPPHPASST